jgi:hypothetical protein
MDQGELRDTIWLLVLSLLSLFRVRDNSLNSIVYNFHSLRLSRLPSSTKDPSSDQQMISTCQWSRQWQERLY